MDTSKEPSLSADSSPSSDVQTRAAWLRSHTLFSDLPSDLVQAIAACLSEQPFEANRRLVLEDTVPDALYILYSGQLESYRTRRLSAAEVTQLPPGTVLHLKALLLDEETEQTVNSLTDCVLWRLDATRFRQLKEEYPVLTEEVTRLLADELESMSERLAYEQERQQALRPYLVTRVKRGVVGASRYAQRLRESIRTATHAELLADHRRRPVLIFGEPGLNKDNLATLIHFGSANKAKPMIRVDCDKLRAQDLFGRGSSQPGLLEWLEDGTLLLNNLQDLDDDLKPVICQLIQTGQYRAVSRDGDAPPASQMSKAWILIVSEQTIDGLDASSVQKIKVPPLRVRKADIEAQVNYFAQLLCRQQRKQKRKLDPAALRRLQSYDFPGNITELENMVSRAMGQVGDRTLLTEEIFWPAESPRRRFRFNLLQGYPRLRRFLLSPWWPDRINFGFTLWFYPIVVAVLFWGPQTRDQNFALNMFWAWWWPLILIGFPFVGRLWCAVCPFMIYGEVTQWLSQKLWPGQLRSWPRAWAERWGGWILYGGFALILLWEELWNLENTAYLSGWLLIVITAGAMVCSLLFERRFWCRYLCPIGGMNGLFAKLSMVELRAQQGICSATCNTYHCYKGGPAEGEGQATAGCPVYSHPAQLTDNRNCVLCMTCLKACPHKSVELNLRPPGIQLWTGHSVSDYEVALLLLLLGAVFLHRLPELTTLLFGETSILETFWGHAGASVVALLAPGVLVWLADRVRVKFQGTRSNRSFLEIAYGFLPLVLFGSLAHYLEMGLTEAGQIIPVAVATVGQVAAGPVWVAHPAVVEFLQGTTLLFGALLSSVLIQKIARQPLQKLIAQHGVVLTLLLVMWSAIVR